MNDRNLILIGGGGHCKSCIDVIENHEQWQIAGIIDMPQNAGREVMGYTMLGTDDDIPSLAKNVSQNFLITVGQIKNAAVRKSLFEKVQSVNGKLPVIYALDSYVPAYAQIGDGTIIMHYAFVNAGAKIGQNTIINTGAIVEHDTCIGSHTHISTKAVINGDARVGDGCLIGSGAVLLNGVEVCNRCIIGAGTVVLQSITEPGTYAGNPARRIG